MTSEPSKSTNKKQLFIVVLIGVVMAILGAVTSFAVTKTMTVIEDAAPKSVPAPTQTTNPSAQSNTPNNVIPVPTPPVTAAPSSQAQSQITNANETPKIEPDSTELQAKIIRIQPEYATVTTSHRSCHWVDRPVVVHYHRAMDGSGVLLGGVTGGILGHQIGGGRGNLVATIGGSVLGAMAGNQIEADMNRPEVHYMPVKVCKRHYEKESVIKGYNVTYIYNGKEETTFMKKRPQSDYLPLMLTPAVES